MSDKKSQVLEVMDGLTYEQWLRNPARSTIAYTTAGGLEFGAYADRKKLAAAVAAGKVAFSPKELRRLMQAHDGTITPPMVEAIVKVKQRFPGARVEAVVSRLCAEGQWVLLADETAEDMVKQFGRCTEEVDDAERPEESVP